MVRNKVKGAGFFALCLSLGLYTAWWDTAKAAEVEAELHPVWVTGYCLQGTMANGEQTREGVCAYRPQDIGKTAIVYTENRELIGIYEITDTGTENIREGWVLDIWKPTKEECAALTQRALVQIVDAEG